MGDYKYRIRQEYNKSWNTIINVEGMNIENRLLLKFLISTLLLLWRALVEIMMVIMMLKMITITV
jgi:hypothetical protein